MSGVPAPARGARAPGLWSGIERVWLDVTAPPLLTRLAELGWSPDAAGASCPTCGRTVGPNEVVEARCSACRTSRLPWSRLVRLGEYRPPLTGLVHEVKFTAWRRLGLDLGRLLGEAVAAQMEVARGSGGALPAGIPLVVPVPMSLPRRLHRGIDHALAIARGVAEATGGRLVQPLRRVHRPSQTAVPASSRAANVAGAFRRRRVRLLGPPLAGRLVILVDDVTTTGATLRAACRAIRGVAGQPGPVIWAAVVAKAPGPGDRLVEAGAARGEGGSS